MGVLDRVNARARGRSGEQRSSIDQWISEYLLPSGMVNQFTFGGHAYGIGGPQLTYGANKAREFSADLPGHTAAVKACPPAFAAQMVRALVLSQARFVFRNPPWHYATPRRKFTTSALALLGRPWPNGTTGDLVSKMEWHAGLAGNAFVTNWQQSARLRVLRPDWTAIVYGSQSEPDDPAGALDGELLGYAYQNGGIREGNQNPLRTLPVSSVAHWTPLPDTLTGLGMSWITPAIREVQGDMLASQHKVTYFSNGATPNLVIKGISAATKTQFDEIVDMLEERHAGIANAYKTLYLTAGADAAVVGANLAEIDFRAVQAGGETRISFLSRVPAPLLGIGEGLAGSSLNAGNFAAARRGFGDSWIFPTLQGLAAAVAPLVNVPPDAELWFDTADMPILREDAKDAAEIEQVKASTITTLVKDGFSPESAIAAVDGQDMTLLVHTGLVSVQLQPPRTELQKAQTIQLQALAAELLVRAGYTTDSSRDATAKQDMSLLQPGPLTSRYLIVNPLEAGAEPGVPNGFPNAAALGLPGPAAPAVPGGPPPVPPAEEQEPPEPSTIPGFTPDAQAGDEPTGGM